MNILPLVIAPDPRLKQKSAPVDKVDEKVLTLLNDMAETMYAARGIGLSAVQVGVMQKLIVVDVDWRDEDAGAVNRNPRFFINAEVVKNSDEQSTYNEGCLSFPDQFAEVERPAEVRVRYLDREGKQQEESFTGLMATCLQHEIDHTDGITFVDHIGSVKRDVILRKMQKAKRNGTYAHLEHGHIHDEHCHHS